MLNFVIFMMILVILLGSMKIKRLPSVSMETISMHHIQT